MAAYLSSIAKLPLSSLFSFQDKLNMPKKVPSTKKKSGETK